MTHQQKRSQEGFHNPAGLYMRGPHPQRLGSIFPVARKVTSISRGRLRMTASSEPASPHSDRGRVPPFPRRRTHMRTFHYSPAPMLHPPIVTSIFFKSFFRKNYKVDGAFLAISKHLTKLFFNFCLQRQGVFCILLLAPKRAP